MDQALLELENRYSSERRIRTLKARNMRLNRRPK